MDGYERIITLMQKSAPKSNEIKLAVMTSSNTCSINGLSLTNEDLLVSEHLKTGWMINNEVYEPLKKGDTVALIRINSTKYLIIDRVVGF